MLWGEPGTGRTLTARVIHKLSPWGSFPFIKVNCASLSENLWESELFGLARPGGARITRGRLEEAEGGSIFLHEVGGLPAALQSRLLRFIQEREFPGRGGVQARKGSVRILAASHLDLAAAVDAGRFAADLYHLLKSFPILLPPLRNRREDLSLLLDYYLDWGSKEHHRRFYFTRRALEILQAYHWPGNVRELKDLVERLCIMAPGTEIDLKDLPPFLFPKGKKVGLKEEAFLPRLKEIEKIGFIRLKRTWSHGEPGF